MSASVSDILATHISLAELAQACRFGRVDDFSRPAAHPTGFNSLDAALPFGGWPLGAVTEIMPRASGIGELKLVMPAVAAMSRERHIVFVAPPHLPYPPALVQQGISLERVIVINRSITGSTTGSTTGSIKGPSLAPSELLWAAEQMLRCSAFGAVLVWPETIHEKELRRLQLAAAAGKNIAIVYRSPAAASSSSPAALRLCLSASEDALRVEIKKCRGGHAGKIVRVLTNDTEDIPPQRVA